MEETSQLNVRIPLKLRAQLDVRAAKEQMNLQDVLRLLIEVYVSMDEPVTDSPR